MNCRFCGAELEEGKKNCPQCGKNNTVVSVWKVVLITLGSVALLAGLTFAVLFAMGVTVSTEVSQEATASTVGEDPTTEATVEPGSVESSLTTSVRDNYTGTDAEAAAAAGEVVATVGGKELTNAELQMFYWMTVYDFLENYSGYLGTLGLDYTKPLEEQILDADTGDTWQQYFLEYALQSWQRYTVVTLLGEEAGHVLTQESLDSLAEVPQTLEKLAADSGYESVLAMIQADMGPGANLEGYMAYMNTTYGSLDYFNTMYEEMTPSMEEIEAFFAENESVFASNGVTKSSGNLVAVRHILVIPEGGVLQDDGTKLYSDDEWAACFGEAERIYDEWLAGEATEESFAVLAETYSEDGGSASNGGLYSQVPEGYMVQPFNDWIFDENREYGDHEIIKTSFGYHIMYFVSSEPSWVVNARAALLSELSSEMIQKAMESYPLEVDFDKIVLGYVHLGPKTE